MTEKNSKTAFIIMPFGIKKDVNGNEINFDLVYKDLIQESLVNTGFQPLRCDEIMQAGSIHKDMFTHIAMDDVAIVDISTLNPNVFYELGVRHALIPKITILIKNRGTSVPFNIQDERVIQYPSENGTYLESIDAIKSFIKAGLKSNSPDSPIFNILQNIRKDWKTERISNLEKYRFCLHELPSKSICVLTGDIREHSGIDVWINSENTNMQMSRYYDKSLSAIIRFEGAEKDENEDIVADTIADELNALLKGKQSVTLGAIYVTSSGALAQSKGVKKIFHIATVSGVPGSGYQSMQDIEKCVSNALRRFDHPQFSEDALRTIAFPMMGTGAGGAKVDIVAPKLIQAAISYLLANPNSRAETVYFSAWNYRDLEACLAVLQNSSAVQPC